MVPYRFLFIYFGCTNDSLVLHTQQLTSAGASPGKVGLSDSDSDSDFSLLPKKHSTAIYGKEIATSAQESGFVRTRVLQKVSFSGKIDEKIRTWTRSGLGFDPANLSFTFTFSERMTQMSAECEDRQCIHQLYYIVYSSLLQIKQSKQTSIKSK